MKLRRGEWICFKCDRVNPEHAVTCEKCQQNGRRGHGHGFKTHKCDRSKKAHVEGANCHCHHSNPHTIKECTYSCNKESCKLIHYEQADKEKAKEENSKLGRQRGRTGCLDMAIGVACYYEDCYFSHDPRDIVKLPWLRKRIPQKKRARSSADYFTGEQPPKQHKEGGEAPLSEEEQRRNEENAEDHITWVQGDHDESDVETNDDYHVDI